MTNLRTEQIKGILLAEQQAKSYQGQIISDLVEGKITLLTAQEICSRLSIDEKIFTLWVRKNEPDYNKKAGEISWEHFQPTQFPKPDIYIAGEARWTKETFKRWLLQQSTK